jgi:hypothetical protein
MKEVVFLMEFLLYIGSEGQLSEYYFHDDQVVPAVTVSVGCKAQR